MRTQVSDTLIYIIYSKKVTEVYCIAGKKFGEELKFGSLAVYIYDHQIKSRQYFILAYYMYVCMMIPYQTAKFKSSNILAIATWGLHACNCQI